MSFCTEQESTYKHVAVIGCGAAGGLLSILLSQHPNIKVTAFDSAPPFSTLLPTGGGRCNISNATRDIKDFVKNYPGGEKFLLSVFSRYNNEKTVKLFEDLGIKTYIQDDLRIFPVSNSSKKTVEILNNKLINDNFKFINTKVKEIKKQNGKFLIYTERNKYSFDYTVIATGGKGDGFKFAKEFGHNIIPLAPSLCALDIKEKYLYNLPGMTFKDCEICFKKGRKRHSVTGDIMITHKSLTGPGIFKVSAICAYEKFNNETPLKINIKLSEFTTDDIEKAIKTHSKKSVKNVFSEFAPANYVAAVCEYYGINADKQTAQIKKREKEILTKSILTPEINAVNKIKGSEIVTAGGVDLNETDSKTMMSKLEENLYFIGEILDIDGFTGGFNLQSCWSCAMICADDIIKKCSL